MRESDAWTIANKVSSKELMRRAGEGIFRSVEWKAPVAIVCGSGNNAGDGYVVADLLRKNGVDVSIVLTGSKFSEDGRYYYDTCVNNGIPVLLFATDASDAADVSKKDPDESLPIKKVTDLRGYCTILDCLLGTGFQGEPRGVIRDAIEKINRSGAFVVSADINSGLNGDTGLGTVYVKSDLTVSIGEYKTGHFRGLAETAMKQKLNVDTGIEIRGDYIWI